jgi:two-component system phosphate regulon response regulator PhoB
MEKAMAKANVLVVEDDEDILELVRYNLEREGYQVQCTTSGEEAVKMAKEKLPDLVVLDLMLPDVDGLEVCKTLKSDDKTAHVPIIMLTAKGEEADVVVGLEMGADDYIVKPFSPRIFLARIKTVLRRGSREAEEAGATVKIHDLVIHPGRHEVYIKNKLIPLTSTEFRILALIARRPGWVFTRYQIVDAVRGEDYPVTDRSVDVHIASLRKKMGSAGKYIETVRSVGYKFKE